MQTKFGNPKVHTKVVWMILLSCQILFALKKNHPLQKGPLSLFNITHLISEKLLLCGNCNSVSRTHEQTIVCNADTHKSKYVSSVSLKNVIVDNFLKRFYHLIFLAASAYVLQNSWTDWSLVIRIYTFYTCCRIFDILDQKI